MALHLTQMHTKFWQENAKESDHLVPQEKVEG
jgi:hypothetical protein